MTSLRTDVVDQDWINAALQQPDPLVEHRGRHPPTSLHRHAAQLTRAKPPRDQAQIGSHYKQRWVVESLFAWLDGNAEPTTTGNGTASASASSTSAARNGHKL